MTTDIQERHRKLRGLIPYNLVGRLNQTGSSPHRAAAAVLEIGREPAVICALIDRLHEPVAALVLLAIRDRERYSGEDHSETLELAHELGIRGSQGVAAALGC